MTTQRPHRSLEEWLEVQRQRVTEPPKQALGHGGSLHVDVYGQPWQAPSIEELEAEGFEIIIRHAHKYRSPRIPSELAFLRSMGKVRDHRGGRTQVTLLGKDGRWARGQVKCWTGDIYSKRIGYVLAVNRALDQLNGQ